MAETHIILDKLINRITQEVDPIRIVLFGSAVTKSISEAGDLDVLIVMPPF